MINGKLKLKKFKKMILLIIKIKMGWQAKMMESKKKCK
jgi:hypothetical protein